MERWKINLYTLWVSQVLSITSFSFGLPFIPFYIQELGVTDPNQLRIYTGILTAAPAVTMAFMAPIWGILSDRFGQKLMIQRAMLTAVFIIGGMGFSTHVMHLVFLRFLQGFFTGTITASSSFVAVNTPNNRLSYALGFLSSSTFVGYSLGPLIGGKVAELYGYKTSFYAGAILMFIGFIMVSMLLKGEKKPSQKHSPLLRGEKKWSDLFSTGIIILLIMLFFQRVIKSLFTPFIPLYIQESTGTVIGAASMTGYKNGLIGFSSALSAITISRLGDKHNKMNLIKIMLSIGFVNVIILGLTKGLNSFIIFYTLLFFITGGIEPLLTSSTAEMTPPEKRGTLFGIQGLVGSIGWMTSPMIGTFISIQFGIHEIFWVIAAILAINIAVTNLVKDFKIPNPL